MSTPNPTPKQHTLPHRLLSKIPVSLILLTTSTTGAFLLGTTGLWHQWMPTYLLLCLIGPSLLPSSQDTPPTRWRHHRQETKPCNALPSASGLPRQLPDKPTSRKANKSTSWQVGKRPRTSTVPAALATNPRMLACNHPMGKTPTSTSHNTKEPASRQVEKPESWRVHHQYRAGCYLPVMVIAQCSHSTLQSLHNAVTPPGARL